jgi:hypothetical protein
LPDASEEVTAAAIPQCIGADCRLSSGRQRGAALKYLAPYIFRVALSNNRIVGMQDDRVTFRYRDRKTKQPRLCTLPALSFIGRFLQHVLRKGFVKVRSYGLFSRRQRQMLIELRQRLLVATPSPEATATVVPATPVPTLPVAMACPVCGQPMQAVVLRPVRSRGPPAVPQGCTNRQQRRQGRK